MTTHSLQFVFGIQNLYNPLIPRFITKSRSYRFHFFLENLVEGGSGYYREFDLPPLHNKSDYRTKGILKTMGGKCPKVW